ncbi:ALF repeat-containing protein [Amycolatopsis rifamycinica]|uniref:Uncharacterized protein n=1 Tax=Amycolatopsis rifamycinica TaxID=287986 RepID=A0A066U9I8_9PSEU|nr:ALF repeat-containing protein [Amycolatopsis rifamycinica]KDN20898.1 hypothetical protein DV20_18140 [Amycolatopsis rifamycinica]
MALLRTGGPIVSRAAEAALCGSDDDVRAFVATGPARMREVEDRVAAQKVLTAAGPATQHRSAGCSRRRPARGFVVVCLVLLERAGVVMEPSDEAQRDLFEARDALAASM